MPFIEIKGFIFCCLYHTETMQNMRLFLINKHRACINLHMLNLNYGIANCSSTIKTIQVSLEGFSELSKPQQNLCSNILSIKLNKDFSHFNIQSPY